MGQIPVSLACRCCSSESSNSPSLMTSSLVEAALDTCCIHKSFPSVHCLEQRHLGVLEAYVSLGETCKTYLSGKMVLRMCWCLSFVWADFSFEDGGEGRK